MYISFLSYNQLFTLIRGFYQNSLFLCFDEYSILVVGFFGSSSSLDSVLVIKYVSLYVFLVFSLTVLRLK